MQATGDGGRAAGRSSQRSRAGRGIGGGEGLQAVATVRATWLCALEEKKKKKKERKKRKEKKKEKEKEKEKRI